ncbi:ATP-dependent RNA helicase DDX24 [Capsaspora owczarzaki ATCC 30864]|uniref:ATP-dependent RNA helicase DDX24 n=2 Tax=Capsaspora owczarzaki (strain ATCC 30864) TaxID=595528 RepID=A0A0D2W0U4_CAPO3|nr:ATP-dependent RNA helicase DDX24 [Capsaspora owczarzaki ATCC 30864]
MPSVKRRLEEQTEAQSFPGASAATPSSSSSKQKPSTSTSSSSNSKAVRTESDVDATSARTDYKQQTKQTKQTKQQTRPSNDTRDHDADADADDADDGVPVVVSNKSKSATAPRGTAAHPHGGGGGDGKQPASSKRDGATSNASSATAAAAAAAAAAGTDKRRADKEGGATGNKQKQDTKKKSNKKNKFKAPTDADIYYDDDDDNEDMAESADGGDRAGGDDNDEEHEHDQRLGRSLKWRNVEIDPSIFTTTEGMDGFLGLEEIDDCDVLYDDLGDARANGQSGKVVKFKRVKNMEALRIRRAYERNLQRDQERAVADAWTVTSEEATGKAKKGAATKPAAATKVSEKPAASAVKEASSKKGKAAPTAAEVTAPAAPVLSKKAARKAAAAAAAAAAAVATPDTSDNADAQAADVDADTVDASSQGRAPVTDMSEWNGFGLHELLIKGLATAGYARPTPIQREALLKGLRDYQDIIGASETGSGKTLAFALPILQVILNGRDKEAARESQNGDDNEAETDAASKKVFKNRPLSALILTPTRELASQIREQIVKVAKFTDISVVTVIGGLSAEKQRRVLSYCPDIVVATPGRLWDYMSQGNQHLTELRYLRHLVLDEADRMVATGHFEELTKILAILPVQNQRFAETDEVRATKHDEILPRADASKSKKSKGRAAPMQVDEDDEEFDGVDEEELENADGDEEPAEDADEDELDEDDDDDAEEDVEDDEMQVDDDVEDDAVDNVTEAEEGEDGTAASSEDQAAFDSVLEKLRPFVKRQTFVFSATMTLDRESFRKSRRVVSKKKKVDRSPLAVVLRQLDMQDDPAIIDLSGKRGLAQTLTEAKISCLKEEKDMYLYYLLKRFPGRTLVFVNSIDCIRRVVSIFVLLGLKPLPLHANLQQRQRMKNLDRFRADPNSFIVATDVAARGLDIAGVDHVIHYQMPRDPETYVHRAGRTARANAAGISICVVGPEDLKGFRGICSALGREDGIPSFPIDAQFLAGIKKRLSLARQIDQFEHKARSDKQHNEWFKKAAQEADIELDEDL